MLSRKQRFQGLKASLTLPLLPWFEMTLGRAISSSGEASTKGSMPGSNDTPDAWERDLALAEHERREAVYEARQGEGDRPSAVPAIPPLRVPTIPGLGTPRDQLPTFDDLTSADPTRAKPARWKLVLALAAALGGLGELARQVSALLTAHGK